MMNTAVIISCYMVTLIGLIFFCREKKKKEEPVIEYEILMTILNNTIQNELLLREKLEYDLKRYVGIPNYKEETQYLVRKIMGSLSPYLLEELELFYSRKYIIAYVTQNVQLFLNDYIRKSKISTM